MNFKDQNNSDIEFWFDSSGGPEEYTKNNFSGKSPKYYFYGSLNEITLIDIESGAVSYIHENVFDFIEEKLNEEMHNPNGIFVSYLSYDLLGETLKNPEDVKCYPDFFCAYFETFSLQPQIHTSQCLQVLSSPNSSQYSLNSNMTDEEYLNKVRRVKEEIKAGNVYQVNLTRAYNVQATVDCKREQFRELDLYLRLRKESPNPFGGYFKTPFLSILSSSPEEFIYINNFFSKSRFIRTRPIKGTLEKSTYTVDEKNSAENIMIVDLERNDLSKICKPNTVKVSKLLDVERYKHLNHVVSTVCGVLRDNISLRSIFEATFPSGSITGAPKIAAMNLIHELEPSLRGAYTGSFGYIKTNGEINFNILIRTIFIEHRADSVNGIKMLKFNVGGGIVADSVAEYELEEIKLKSIGILNSVCTDDSKIP